MSETVFLNKLLMFVVKINKTIVKKVKNKPQKVM